MSASAREAEARKIAAVIAAVQAYLESETQGGKDGNDISAWRREMLVYGEPNDAFSARHRSWTGRN